MKYRLISHTEFSLSGRCGTLATLVLAGSWLAAGSAAALTAADWISMGGIPGTNASVLAVVADGGGNVIVGGAFTKVANIDANRVARWNGATWTPLGSGLDGTVQALAVVGTDVFAGGTFTSAGGQATPYLAKWNGTAWSAVGSGPSGAVSALATMGSDLFVGGSFATAGGTTVNSVAKWNGTAWSALGNGLAISGSTPFVAALTVDAGALYVGGTFSSVGGVTAGNVAKWNGSSWTALGSGLNDSVYALTFSGSSLYACGSFTQAGGVSASKVARWNGTSWSALGTGVDGAPRAMTMHEGNLVVGGYFTTAGGVSAANSLAQWDGAAWHPLGTGVSRDPMDLPAGIGFVYALASQGPSLHVGGEFGMAGASALSNFGVWRAGAWVNAGSPGGPNAYVTKLGVCGDDLYVAGNFDKVGGVFADRVAKWDGSKWSALGMVRPLKLAGGQTIPPECFASIGSDIYVGGSFVTAGSVSANNIAKWNGREWSALGAGVNGTVRHAAAVGNELYVAGDFTVAGGIPANGLAKWDGSQWSAVAHPFLGVGPMTVWNGDLYITGPQSVASIPEEPLPSIMSFVVRKVSGGWEKVGSGFVNSISAIAGGSSGLHIIDWSPPFGGDGSLQLRKWNGSSWSAVGASLTDFYIGGVHSLAVRGNDVFVGSQGLRSGTMAFGMVAHWNGSAWSGVGLDPIGEAFSLVSKGDDLYLGGYFLTVGSKSSPYLVRANLAGGVADSDADGLLDSWEIAHFAFREGHGPLDDSDFDGITALREEALGLDPMTPDVAGEPPVMMEGGYLTMTVRKRPGVAYQVQTGGSLLSGQPDSFGPATTTVLIDNAMTLKVRDNVPAGTGPRRFMRLEVTAAP